ncbi:HyaD/HybD family hydrogenase maturation endopeptidase [Bradyrhizobium sediminis]|uniref:Hydrogenase expression/formation protein HupD n=1 Tax=Bradyrhizobium sediminis TaxID=2840469 RepID=A0A975NGW1_9BRAD|nr:HyaD/HybD family hydrogenase maturation endopeptidase [Bradyrhizobium sediminis]QWG14590.1 HyaD/HybD family hydrogenase maturation endopeptidase [Bradyrhizobium sediminis]
METPKVLIIGIGNLLWADEGFGVRAVEAMHRHYEWPGNVRLMDGGTQGLYLVQHVREADILIVFDAVDYGLPPGTIKLVEGDEVPKFLGAKKISLHQTGFQEVLATAELLGGATQHLYLIGVQPVELDDFGGSLRDEMKARIGPAIQHAIDFLARFGIGGRLRDVPLPETETLACEHMVMSRYEAQRPSAEDACRFGDPRVLVMTEQTDAADQQPPQMQGAR